MRTLDAQAGRVQGGIPDLPTKRIGGDVAVGVAVVWLAGVVYAGLTAARALDGDSARAALSGVIVSGSCRPPARIMEVRFEPSPMPGRRRGVIMVSENSFEPASAPGRRSDPRSNDGQTIKGLIAVVSDQALDLQLLGRGGGI